MTLIEFDTYMEMILFQIFHLKISGGISKKDYLIYGDDDRVKTVNILEQILLEDYTVDNEWIWNSIFDLSYNNLDHLLRPMNGNVFGTKWGVYHSLDNNQIYHSKFFQFSGYFMFFQELFRQRVFSFQGKVSISRTFHQGIISFYDLPYLGSEETLRGFERGRFRDRDMIFFQSEYRYPISEKTNALILCDCGRVFHNLFADLSGKYWKFSAGFGFQVYKNPEDMRFSIITAFSSESIGFYFKLNEF